MVYLNSKGAPHTSDAQYLERLKNRIKVSDSGCWEWQGFVNPHTGYCTVGYRGRPIKAHRLMYLLTKGSIPPKTDCCHSCDNRRCINPDHLWLGTRQQNLLDASAKGRIHCQQKTHCPKGHAYAEHGVRHGKAKWRKCTICTRARLRIKAGWPEDIAYSMPAQGHGYRPINADWKPTGI